jgi:nitrite reductase (NADH) large subunit
MTRTRYLIVGGSAAGMAAAQAIGDHDARGQIRVLSQEADAPYFRPMIPYLVSGKKLQEEILLQGMGPFRHQNMDVRLNTRVVGVDTDARQVHTADGEAIEYDRLLIATGSQPVMPPDTLGLDAEGVMPLRTMADARRMAQRARQSRQAVMLGAGLLGLKAAVALRQSGLDVTLVEKEDEILPWLVEADAGARIRSALHKAGINVVTDATIRCIEADAEGGVRGVVLDNGRELVCQLVGIGIGVVPDTTCLAGSGIHVDGGVVTDTHTACNAPDVYAAGDVAVTYDTITGRPIVARLWTNAVEMGRCAGFNMAGHPTVYGGTFGILNATQVAGLPFVSMGIVHTAGTDYEVHVRESSDAYRKLVFSRQGDRLIGVVFIGDIDNTGLYRALIQNRTKLDGVKRQVIDHRLHFGHLLLAGKP